MALGLRLFHLSQRVIWFDEANSLLIAQAAPAQIANAVLDDTHSPFYYVALHYWQFLCHGEMGARLLSVFAGAATVLIVYFLGSELVGCTAGLLSAALFSLCPLHIWYSQEIRMYALQTLLLSASFLFMMLALRRERAVFWVVYNILTAMSLYTQYISIFAVIGQNIFVLIYYRKDHRRIRDWFLAQATMALLFAPWLPGFLAQMKIATSSTWSSPLEPKQVFGVLSLFSGAYVGDSRSRVISVLITIAVLVVVTVILVRRKESRPTVTLLLLWFALPIVLLILQSLNQNRFLPRVLVCITPAFALLLGCAAAQADKALARGIAAFAVIALIASNAFALHNYYLSANAWVKSDLRESAIDLAKEFQTGDIIVHTSEFSYRPFEYYLGRDVAQGVVTPPQYLSHLFRVTGDGRLPENAADFHRIWLVLYPDQFHPERVQQTIDWMNQHHHLVRWHYSSGTVLIGLYERQGA